MAEKEIKKPKEVEKKPKTSELAVKVLAVMEALRKNGVVETNSTVLRDKLGLDKETGRDKIRRIMRALNKEGKVVISTKKIGEKRKRYVYRLP